MKENKISIEIQRPIKEVFEFATNPKILRSGLIAFILKKPANGHLNSVQSIVTAQSLVRGMNMN
jgi:hypothetical protein